MRVAAGVVGGAVGIGTGVVVAVVVAVGCAGGGGGGSCGSRSGSYCSSNRSCQSIFLMIPMAVLSVSSRMLQACFVKKWCVCERVI